MTVVQKSSVAKSRHRRVAAEYQKWLKACKTQNTPRKRQIEMFDLLCDTAYLNDLMKRNDRRCPGKRSGHRDYAMVEHALYAAHHPCCSKRTMSILQLIRMQIRGHSTSVMSMKR